MGVRRALSACHRVTSFLGAQLDTKYMDPWSRGAGAELEGVMYLFEGSRKVQATPRPCSQRAPSGM
jgi:hypothetical protein